MTKMSVIPTGAQRNGGIYRSRYDAGQCQDSSTTLRFGRNDIRGGAFGMTDKSVIPNEVPLHICHPAPTPVIPTGAQRTGGIYRSRYDAGKCQDSSTSLRSGRNDKWGAWSE